MDRVRPESVAMIAQRIMENEVQMGALAPDDFLGYRIPGTNQTYKQRTFDRVTTAAWELIESAIRTKPI